MTQRLLCYLFMGLLSPTILFAFFIVFGWESYQWWGDHFHYELTNRYLFSMLPADTVLGPLWRDDIFSGNVWAISVGPAPFAVVMVLGRLFHLSPLGFELVGNLTLYFIAVVSMYLYLRRVLSLHIESATVAAVMFAATAYWVSQLVGNPDLPMAIAWLPALLVMAHKVADSTDRRSGLRILLSMVGLSLLFFGCAIHGTLASLPITPILLVAYACFVFRSGRSVLLVVAALGVGLLLYSPYLWTYVEAARFSHRYAGMGFFTDPFNPQDPLEPLQLLIQARLMLSRLVLGHNQYGVYLVVILVMLMWFYLGPRWDREQRGIRRILQFALGSSLAIFMIELFEMAIDYAKVHVPLFGGWRVKRFQYASFFGTLTLVAWMMDRSLFRSGVEVLPLQRLMAVRRAIVCVGGLGFLQVAYSAYRMAQVPSSIYPQNLVLYAGLLIYAGLTVALLVLFYRETQRRPNPFSIVVADSPHLWWVALIVLCVSLTTSIHAYRQAVVGMRGSDLRVKEEPIMNFAERYTVPQEILSIKRLNVSDGRVVDLTRPWYKPAMGPAGETTLLPLGMLRTPSGFNFFYPTWYERFIYVGINGTSGSPESIAQIDYSDETNFEALGLLDVQYVLAPHGSHLAGYVPVSGFQANGKTLHTVEEPDRVGPAFVSPSFQCFPNDGEALSYIHHSSLPELKARAILIASDVDAALMCTTNNVLSVPAKQLSLQIRTQRSRDRVSVQVENSAGGILTLADTYYPGWKVVVNGAEKPLLRTYTTLRGVAIEPGRQSVEFIYAPKTFYALLYLSNSVLGFLLLAGLGMLAWERTTDRRLAQQDTARI